MATFYTSDDHFGHRGILRLERSEFSDVDEMNEHLISQWNDVVSPEDTVFNLGDISLGNVRTIEHIGPRLNGQRKVLVGGNHDPFWTGHSRPRHRERYAAAGFDLVPEGWVIHTIAGHEILLSHLPYHGDSQHDERYADKRPQDWGLPIVCGHVHSTWRRLYGGDGRIHRGQVNVGVDVWGYRPVSEDALIEALRIARPDVFEDAA